MATDGEKRDGYEGWLDEIAGRRVKTFPLFLVWLGAVAVAAVIAFVAGADTETLYMLIIGLISGLYWLVAVPGWLKHKG